MGQKQACAMHAPMSALVPSDRNSEFPHKVMSALPLIADICGAMAHVGFGPRADIPPFTR